MYECGSGRVYTLMSIRVYECAHSFVTNVSSVASCLLTTVVFFSIFLLVSVRNAIGITLEDFDTFNLI